MRLPTLLLGVSMLGAGLAPAWAAKPDAAPVAPLRAALSDAIAGELHLAPIDLPKLSSEDALLDGKFGVPIRYGITQDARMVDAQAKAGGGTWSTLSDGRLQWRLEVVAQDAKTLEFAFETLRLPHGAELRIEGLDSKDALGPYTDADNRPDGRFNTPMLLGSHAALVVTLPAAKRDALQLQLDTVSHGYRDPFEASTFAKSGSCNIDVACSVGDAWREQIASVAHYTFNTTGGSFVCTGQLMATGNTSADLTQPRFSTAHHCVSTTAEVSSMVFYWGYESPTCRTPGSAASGTPLNRAANTRATQNGATLLATHEATDWSVVQLQTAVPAAANAYWSGWDRRGVAPPGTVGIHHPEGDEKRITFNDDPPTTVPICIASSTSVPNSHWHISEYEQGTTEGGSSGSGLWSSDTKQLIGVLSGGSALCTVPDGSDCYGRLSTAWDGGGTVASRMRDHLDRTGTNPQQMAGAGTCAAPTVTLTSPAFTTDPSAGNIVVFTAGATGGAGNYTYAWDFNGDGGIDQNGAATIVQSVYNSRQSVQVRVTATDSAGCSGSATGALDVKGPAITVATVGAPAQVCGNGDAKLDPGERWKQTVNVSNTGDGTIFANVGHSLFAASDAYGVATGAACSYGFIDIASGGNAVAALPLTAAPNSSNASDDGRTAVIALGGGGLRFDGQTHTQAVMGTNGYVSFNAAESGGDYDNGCNTAPDRGSASPQLRVQHQDLVVGSTAGAGLRYRYFATCPRTGSAAGCHVFQWSRMAQYTSASTPASGDFEFQAVVYDDGAVTYQYNTASPTAGANATIGYHTAAGAVDARCNTANAAPAQSAICIAPMTNSARVETPTLPLPALTAGALTTLDVTFAVPSTAACGAPIAIDYLASASDNLSSVEPKRIVTTAVGAGCAAVSNCPVQAPTINGREGLYFNPMRPGNGLASYSYGGGWYTADPDRRATWYQLSGSYVDNLMRIPLGRTRNAAAPNGVDVVLDPVGKAWLARTNENQQMFVWQMADGRKGAEMMSASLAGTTRPTPNRTETWFSLNQSGWGLAIESAKSGNDTLEAYGVFLYDSAGAPRWVLGQQVNGAAGPVSLFTYRPHCPGCPWLPTYLQTQAAAGTMTATWTGATGGTVSTAITLPAPLQGTWNRTALPFIPIMPPDQP